MDEFELFEKIKLHNRDAFNILFRRYYSALCRFSFAICASEEDAEESVQEMFVHLWEKAPGITIGTSVKAYLYMSVRNHTINMLNKQQTEIRHLNEYSENTAHDDEEGIPDAKISQLIQAGVETLPEKCREIFILCKQEGLTYDEIAEYLNISKKTVDNQMGIALHKLRDFLQGKMKGMAIILLFLFAVFRGN